MIHEETVQRRLPGSELCLRKALQWVCSSGGTRVAGRQQWSVASGMGRSPSVSSDQTQPSSNFCQQLLAFIGVASEVGFWSFFFLSAPSPLLLGTPGLFPFLDRALKLWNSLALLLSGLCFNCLACARRIVEGIHPLTAIEKKPQGKGSPQPPSVCSSSETTTYSNKIKRSEAGVGGGVVRDF